MSMRERTPDIRERTPEERFRSLRPELRETLEAAKNAHIRATEHQRAADHEFRKVRTMCWKLSMFGVPLRTIALGIGVSKSQASRLVGRGRERR